MPCGSCKMSLMITVNLHEIEKFNIYFKEFEVLEKLIFCVLCLYIGKLRSIESITGAFWLYTCSHSDNENRKACQMAW